jgi:hypothetical protein
MGIRSVEILAETNQWTARSAEVFPQAVANHGLSVHVRAIFCYSLSEKGSPTKLHPKGRPVSLFHLRRGSSESPHRPQISDHFHEDIFRAVSLPCNSLIFGTEIGVHTPCLTSFLRASRSCSSCGNAHAARRTMTAQALPQRNFSSVSFTTFRLWIVQYFFSLHVHPV